MDAITEAPTGNPNPARKAPHGYAADDIVITAVFAERRQKLCGIAYTLLRMLEIGGAWLASTADLEIKLALGNFLGFAGEELGRIEARARSLLADRLVMSAAEDHEALLAQVSQIPEDHVRAGAFSALLAGLLKEVDALGTATDPVADAPTRRLLTELSAELRAQELTLRALGRHHGDINFVPPVTRVDAPLHSYNGTEALPELVAIPNRPAKWKYDSNPVFTHTSLTDLLQRGEHLKRWLHEIGINVEINAMELCGRNIAEFRSMPLEFKLDMARQAWDETRHAQLMRDQLLALGGDYGDYTYNDKVWQKYMLGETLAERLAIEQIFQEGNALEANVAFGKALREVDAYDLAAPLDYINADEMRHAFFGNKWLRVLCNDDNDAFITVVRSCAEKIGMPLRPRAPLHRQLREMAAFPEPLIRLLADA